MRSRSFATVSAGLVGAHRRPGNFPGHRSKNQVSLKGKAAFLYGLSRHHERGESRLHIGRPQTKHLAVPHSALELIVRLELAAEHSIFFGAGITRIHVTIDHERDTVATSFYEADGIDAIGVDFLAHRLNAMSGVPIQDKLADRLLRAGGARNIDQLFRELSQLVALNAIDNILLIFLTDHAHFSYSSRSFFCTLRNITARRRAIEICRLISALRF